MLTACCIALAVLTVTPGIDPMGPAGELPLPLELDLAPTHPAPNPPALAFDSGARTSWADLIDYTWGEGLSPEDHLATFDDFWTWIDESYACFHGIDDRWDELRNLYRPEVAAGVSKGRFAGILGQLSLSLKESHTKIYDWHVVWTECSRWVPLLVASSIGAQASQVGAAVTALDDGTGLVYRTTQDNPLGLAPGDIILGYDGRPWSECLDELLAAELPIKGFWGSSPESWEHHWISAVGANFHLFNQVDILKHATGEVIQRPCALQTGHYSQIFASDQLDVGIPFPDIVYGETVTWGVLERRGAQIGYVYVYAWGGAAGQRFYAAIDDLTTNYDTDGLIIDFRYNGGGNMFLSDDALGLLFAETVPTIEWFYRCDPGDHLALCCFDIWQTYVITNQPVDRYYDRPIAVLTGPGAVSSGDQVALRMSLHPCARVFGKSTAAAFNAPESIYMSGPFNAVNATAECALLDALDEPLTHLDFPVDERVWLEPDDVAQGIDTVVEAAANWITSGGVAIEGLVQPDQVPAAPAESRFLGAHPNPFNPTTTLVFTLDRPAAGELVVCDLAGRRLRMFPLDGLDAGQHRVVWDGRDDAGRLQASGTYLVQLRTENRIHSGRVMLVK